MQRLALTLTLVVLGLAPGAQAADVCPQGALAMVRVSKITGTRAQFLEAVADQAAWYAAHGLADKIVLADVIEGDKAGEAGARVSETQAMTIHYYPGNVVVKNQHDDAWKAFVAKFRASSDIASETLVCLPK